jgi:hypothetical protein
VAGAAGRGTRDEAAEAHWVAPACLAALAVGSAVPEPKATDAGRQSSRGSFRLPVAEPADRAVVARLVLQDERMPEAVRLA